jgi:protein-arginine kinase activator protein McsA
MDTELEENEFSVLSNSELDGLLRKSIEKDDYERASLIRDELKKRKNK